MKNTGNGSRLEGAPHALPRLMRDKRKRRCRRSAVFSVLAADMPCLDTVDQLPVAVE